MAFMHKDLNDMQYVHGPLAIAAPYVQHATLDGKTIAYGTTVPSDATIGYSPGCQFWDLSAGALYINEGTKTSCAFKKLTSTASIVSDIEDAGHLSGTAAGLGPSPLIWDESKLLEVMLDPTAGFLYFNDFMGQIDATDGDGFTLTQSELSGQTCCRCFDPV